MTKTDNRTTEPTEAQVEAAAKEYTWNGSMRAALVAAQEAAPQAASEPLREALHRAREHFTAIAASGEIRVWEDTGEKFGIDSQVRGWAKRGERICFDALSTPVLPSSTVDEDALALIVEAEMLSDAAVSDEWSDFKVEKTAERIARAVSKWLKGGAR